MEPQQIPIFGTVDAAAKFWMLIFGIWAICAVVNVAIADLKGRNRTVWGLIGLIFGPFGIFALLVRLNVKLKPTSESTELKDKP